MCDYAWKLSSVYCSKRLIFGRKEWGIENFISPTLLRNMSEKDLKKAIGYHLKKIRALLDPKQKVLESLQEWHLFAQNAPDHHHRAKDFVFF